MEILKQIAAKNKAIAVIKSCENIEQYEVAQRYVNNYFNKFDDLLGLKELDGVLQSVEKRLGYDND